MNEPSIFKNFIYNVGYQILAIIVPLVTSPYIARTLGAEMIGISSWTFSVMFYFNIFSVLGIGNYGNRTIAMAREKDEDIGSKFSSIYFFQLLMSLIVIIFYGIYTIFLADKYIVILWLQGFHILANMVDVTWFFYGIEDFRSTVIRNCFVKIFTLICIFAFIKSPSDLWIYTLINAGSAFVGQAVMWPKLLRRVKLKKVKINEIIPHIKPIIILFIPILAISVFTNMDKYMIGIFSNATQCGFYENTDKIIGIPKALITALGTVMLPRTANLVSKGEEKKSIKYIENTMLFTFIVGSALVFGMMGVADIFSVIFWGENFRECGNLIEYMAPAILFSVIGNVVRTQYLIPRSKDKEYTISLIVGAIVNFVVNYTLIPEMGASGAVVGTVIAEFSMTALQIYYVRKYFPIEKYLLENALFLIFGLIMFCIICFLKGKLSETLLSLIVLIIMGGTFYIILCFTYTIITKRKTIIELRKVFFNKIINRKGV